MITRLPILLVLIAGILTSCGRKYDGQINCDTPMTYEEAYSKKLGFPLPKGCFNVTYAEVADWQLHDIYARFEAPVDVCLRHIDTVLAWHDSMYKNNTSYPKAEITNSMRGGGDLTIPAPWFDLDKLKHGIEAGTNASHQPMIWVDTDRGVFYFHETD